MDIASERLLEETGCPVCLQLLDAASAEPSPRDLTVCLYCASFLQFTDELELRLLGDAELVELPHEVQVDLHRVRRTIITTDRRDRREFVITVFSTRPDTVRLVQ